MKCLATTSHKSGCRGLAMVELVIAIPIFLLLVVATAEFGRAFLQYNTLSKGVQDGARFIAGKALNGTTGVVTVSSTLQTQTRNVVIYGNTVGAGAPILPGLVPAQITVANAGGQNVVVTANYPYNPIFAFVPGLLYGGNFGMGGHTLRAAVTMRAL